MPQIDQDELRRRLTKVAASRHELYAWETGSVVITLADGEAFEAEVIGVGGDVVRLEADGESIEVRLAEIVDLLVRIASPGPE